MEDKVLDARKEWLSRKFKKVEKPAPKVKDCKQECEDCESCEQDAR